MTRISRMMALGLWLGVACLPLTAREPSRNLEDLVRLEAKVEGISSKVLPATVALLSEATGSSGSGVITTEDGLILTAAHVVQGAEELLVVFPDGKQVPGKVLGANYSKDIAMVKITEPGKWPFVEMGTSKSLEAGDWVIALGHSAGFDANRPPPVRFGRVISKGPGNFLTTDCTLIGGDSGGPLFDLDGKIVGIHSSIGQSLTNNNHAGIDGFREDWDRIIVGEAWGELSLNPFANPEMPVIGIGMGRVRGIRGVFVESVVHGSPAAAAGVRPGDVIRTLDGSPVRDGAELLQILAKRQSGDLIKVGVLREQKALDIDVTLKRRNELYQEQSIAPQVSAIGQGDIPLLRPEERAAVDAQTGEFNESLVPALTEAAKSTVRVWSGSHRLAYGTVIGDGHRVLTKWSELMRANRGLLVESASGDVLAATLAGVYPGEDLAVLKTDGPTLTPVKWSGDSPPLGAFLVAPQPDGRPAAFGVVSVLERNLRDTDRAFLGVEGTMSFEGPGVKIASVTPESGAAAAGLQAGDVILKVGDRAISGLLELKNSLVGVSPGTRVKVLAMVGPDEKEFDVLLGNRPDLPNPLGNRLRYMERMGSENSRVRDSFSSAIQTDMRPNPHQIGGPVVDLEGHVVGITLARADRTRSFVMPAAAVEKLLATQATDPALAQAQKAKQAALPVKQPSMRNVPPPGSHDRMRQHLSEMERLMEFMREEMDALESDR